jgi:hypothetical protein
MLKPLTLKKSGLLALALAAATIAGCNSNSSGGGTTTGSSSDTASLDTGATVATVGGENISRGEMFSFLEANAGEAALRQLIDYHLVMQDAKTKNIDITDAELDAEIKRRSESDPRVAEVVKGGGSRLDSLKRQLGYQMALDRILVADVKADPSAVTKWLATNDPTVPGQKTSARYGKPEQVKLGILLTSQKARADVMASQLKGGKSFSDLVAEQKKAKDQVASGSTANTSEGSPASASGGYLPIAGLPKPLQTALASLKVNGTTPVVAISPAQGKAPGLYAIVQLLDRQAEVKANPSDPTVVMDYKLTQVATATVKKLSPKSTLDQAVQGIIQQAQQSMMQAMQQGNFSQQAIPTYREALDSINRSQVNDLLAKLRTSEAAKVAIPDKQYAALEANYKPATPATAPGAAGNTATGTASNEVAPAAGTEASPAANAVSNAAAPAATTAP